MQKPHRKFAKNLKKLEFLVILGKKFEKQSNTQKYAFQGKIFKLKLGSFERKFSDTQNDFVSFAT